MLDANRILIAWRNCNEVINNMKENTNTILWILFTSIGVFIWQGMPETLWERCHVSSMRIIKYCESCEEDSYNNVENEEKKKEVKKWFSRTKENLEKSKDYDFVKIRDWEDSK